MFRDKPWSTSDSLFTKTEKTPPCSGAGALNLRAEQLPRVAKNFAEALQRGLTVPERLTKVTPAVGPQSKALEKLPLSALEVVLHQVAPELSASAPRALQQALKQLTHWPPLRATLEALALRAAEPTVAPTCAMCAQVKLLLLRWSEA